MTRMRIPMFFKFLAGCMLLAVMLVGAGSFLLHKETQMRGRTDWMARNFQRYVDYQAGVGTALTTAAGLLAADERLRAALGPGPGDPDDAPIPAAEVARTLSDLLAESSLEPEMFLVFDRNRLIYASASSPIDAQDLAKLEVVRRVRDGLELVNETLIHRGNALQIGAAPIRPVGGGDPIGGLLVGVELKRYLDTYQRQSDRRENRQHRLTLVDRRGGVVASVFPREMWSELEEAIKPENWLVQDDESGRRRVMIAGAEYDIYGSDVAGFEGQDRDTAIGRLYLVRGIATGTAQEPGFPVREIIFGGVLSVVIASLLAFWITRPIKRFVRQSQAMLEGGADLSQRIDLGSRDETSDLAENINHVFARLYRLASEVQHAAFQVGASSAEISAASKQMLEGFRDQTLKIESSTAAVTELSASIQQVAQNAVEATKVAEKSNVAVTSAVDRMQQIRTAVEEAAEKMRELGESSKRIGNIVEVIRQISEQTSLLALNASIEAAHAGEQGRGFAVVADEVSSLARRVGQSAKDIEALIQTIKEQTSEAVHSMQVGSREVEQGTSLVTNTLTDLGQLIHVVNDTAAAVQEQAEVSDEIARNMDAVQKIAAEMVSGSEEAVIQGEQLHSLAFDLERSVGGFNIGGDDRGDGQHGDGVGDADVRAVRPPAGPGDARRALKGGSAPRR